MWICSFETLCLDYPRVEAPHYRYISGIHLRPANPLPPELLTYADSADKGLVVVTLGSGISCLPAALLRGILASCKNVPLKFIARHACPIQGDIHPNLKAFSWLPQNDLLGHKNTKLFITHGGSNGLQEAIYHGIPVIVIPVMFDQRYNAKLAINRGYGLTLDKSTMTEITVRDAITTVWMNDSYTKNIQQCSAIIRESPNPRKKVAQWIEHIVFFGGKHLKPRFFGMPLWEYYMLDMVCVLSTAVCLSAFCLFICSRHVVLYVYHLSDEDK